MLPIPTIPKAEPACPCVGRRWTSPLSHYPRCKGLDNFFQPSTSAKILCPLRLVHPRCTEWWDDDGDYSPFYLPDHPTPSLDISRFKISRCKRENTSCRVAVAKHVDTGSIVSMKIFDRGSRATLSRAMNEIRAYKRVVEYPDSQCLVEALAAFRDSDYLYIVIVRTALLQPSYGCRFTRQPCISPHLPAILLLTSGRCHRRRNSQRLSYRR